MDNVKSILVLAVCCAALLVNGSQAQNLLTNGDFSGNLANWTVTSADPLAAVVAAGDGNPSPGLYVSRGTDPTHVLTNGAAQIIPAVAGRKYQLRGQWKGMIMGRNTLGDPNGTTFAEVNVSFLPAVDTPYIGDGAPAVAMQIKKRWAYPGTNPSYTFNVDPATGTWGWESISLSPVAGDSESMVAPDGTNYMAVWVNFACSVGNDSTTVYINVDNLAVMACQEFVEQDLDSDCKVDFKDFSVLANTWLACGIDPVTECWN